MPPTTRQRFRFLCWATAFAIGCSWGCASHSAAGGGPAKEVAYFEAPAITDPWTPKIAGWQSRENRQPDIEQLESPAQVSGSPQLRRVKSTEGDLRKKYFDYRREQKRELARGVADWIQREARNHYVPDGPIDHWATLEETLVRNGDDCDGLELLVFHFLRDLGFAEDEVYRAIVVRPEDGQHHMVTFWFETPDDPWVIDPTGAMTSGMPRMSEVPGWEPLKVFHETAEWSPQPQRRTLTAQR